MRSRKRTPHQTLHDRAKIARAYLQGTSQRQIAEELKLSPHMVSDDLRAIQDEWRQSALRDFDEAKAQELAKIDELEREYWTEWQRSKKERRIASQKQVTGEHPREEESLRKEEMLGDPRYLNGIQWCIAKRCEILGLDAPVKMEHSGTIDTPERLTDEQIKNKIRTLLEKTGIAPTLP